jgi:sugar phosphate permease
LVNGCLVMFGGVGAYVAAGPTDALMRWSDWRLVFLLLAGVTALAGLMILLAVPDRPRAAPTMTLAKALAGLRTVYSDPFFWRIAPASACAIGTAWAIQGLWAARWLAEVDGLSRGEIVVSLSAMAAALAVGALFIGIAGDRLKRAGVNARVPLVAAFTTFALLQMAIIEHLPIPRLFLWCGFAALGGATVLSYAALAENFPQELAGRANGALNLMHIGVAFLVQWGIGAVIDLWPATASGNRPAIAYETAFALALAAQAVAIAWLLAPAWTARGRMVPAADEMMSVQT